MQQAVSRAWAPPFLERDPGLVPPVLQPVVRKVRLSTVGVASLRGKDIPVWLVRIVRHPEMGILNVCTALR